MGQNKFGLPSVCNLIIGFVSMLNIWVIKHSDTCMHRQMYIPIMCPLYIYNFWYLAAVDNKLK